MRQAIQVGKRGTITIPKRIREAIGLEEGSILVFEVCEEGLLMKPAIATPMKPEEYSTLRKAEFLLNNAVDAGDYQRAREEVRSLGLDPDEIPHDNP